MVVTDNDIFSGIQKALKEFAKENKQTGDTLKDYVFAGLIPNDDQSSFSILISADWLGPFKSESKVVDALLPFLRAEIPGNNHRIDTINVIKSDDELADNLGMVRALNFQKRSAEFPDMDNVRFKSYHFDKIYLL